MSKQEISDPIYAVRAEAVPVTIFAYELGRHDYRIKIGRGIGWTPERYRTREAVLAKLVAMRSYGMDEAMMAKRICRADP